jgi:hypothetical protein
MAFGSAPGKHFLQNQVGVPDTNEAIQATAERAPA